MSEHKAVLWDLDNTLLPSKELTREVFEVILPEFGVRSPSKKDIHNAFGLKLEDFVAHLSDNHPNHPKILDRFLEEQDRRYRQEITLFEGMLEVIGELGELGLKQAIVTTRGNIDRNAASATNIVIKSGIGDHIDVVVNRDDTDNHKPHPEPVLLALSQLSIEPKNAVMVGDQTVDMQAGKTAGTYALGIDHDVHDENIQSLWEAGADHVVHQASEIVPYVRDLFKIK
jgi:pyrophosphatase PpaX